ncbi:hypothetical protein ADIAL_1056 [Alkalibacterium sp. AK22]|uniref:hypothetical protein n=1 Tax=Alkalibacterium sp. AK22 TaxID=1229520 RepID=UPI00044B2589|nr:hypothetical protein [Alkalibacterium sp. AK22]EXJ23444.1 hypothetical protein ADIAL_1056 [Alkalibacterium sp. AK22]
MDYKKLVSLLAVSTFALAACDADTEEDTTTDTEVEDEESADVEDTAEDTDADEGADNGNGQSAHDVIDGIEGDLGFTAAIELEILGGSWSQDGYVFMPEDGEATVNATAVSEEDVYAFVIQNGEVIETPEVEEGAFSFTAEASGESEVFQVGVANEELYEVGDEADTEELVRYENVVISPADGE